uniref:Uncharacterized protein n=1 Tax=Methanococcus maripaludis (strain C6 / ATCC BAA-1332) TaxID=444158 RepID=A9ABA4_METM6
MFFEKYIKEPLQYSLSDYSKVLKGGIIFGMGLLLSLLGIILFLQYFNIYSYLSVFPENFILPVAVLSLIMGLILFIVLDGYLLNVLKLSIKKSSDLPEWNNYIELFKTGFLFSMGLIIISSIGPILQNLIRSFDMNLVLFLLSMSLKILASLYVPLSAVNYAQEGRLASFFDFPKIFKMISREYILVFLAVRILAPSFVAIPMSLLILLMIAILYIFGFRDLSSISSEIPLLLILLIPLYIIFSINTYWVGLYSYRVFTNYFISKNSDQKNFQ